MFQIFVFDLVKGLTKEEGPKLFLGCSKNGCTYLHKLTLFLEGSTLNFVL